MRDILTVPASQPAMFPHPRCVAPCSVLRSIMTNHSSPSRAAAAHPSLESTCTRPALLCTSACTHNLSPARRVALCEVKKPLFCACSPHTVLLPSLASTFRGRLTTRFPHTPRHPSTTIRAPPAMASKRHVFAPSYPLIPSATPSNTLVCTTASSSSFPTSLASLQRPL